MKGNRRLAQVIWHDAQNTVPLPGFSLRRPTRFTLENDRSFLLSRPASVVGKPDNTRWPVNILPLKRWQDGRLSNLFGVHTEMVAFGSEQGLSIFETAGIASYFEDFKKREDAAPGLKMPFMDGHHLMANHVTTPKKADFYLHWVRQFHKFQGQKPGAPVTALDIERFLGELARNREAWQVDQADEAIKLYKFYQTKQLDNRKSIEADATSQWKETVDTMRRIMRLRHLSYRTEQTYVGWVRRFYRYVNGSPPYRLHGDHVKNFLTHLAVEKKVAASTQNQAFNAILFLFRNVLNKSIAERVNENETPLRIN